MAGNKEKFQKSMNSGHSAAWDQDWEKAAKYYNAALKEIPDHSQALTSLGLALFELQNYPAALRCYQKAASLAPDDAVPQEKIARIYEQMGKLSEAISSSLHAAELHMKARSAEKAIDNWIRVLNLQPDNINVRTRLAAVYEKLGRRDDAIAEYISAASILQHSGDLTRATKAVEYALKVMPENQEVRLALSMVRSNRPLPRPNRARSANDQTGIGHAVEADSDSQKRGRPDPIAETRQKAMVELASMLFDQAEENNAAASSERGKGIGALTRGQADLTHEGSARARIILHIGQAIDSLTQSDSQQAVVELEHALNLGLRQPAAYYLSGLLTKDTDPEKALKYLQQSVRHPEFSLASNLLFAQVHEREGRWREASASYLQSLAIADSMVVPPDQADELISQYETIIDSQSAVEDQSTLQATCKAISNQLLRQNWRNSLLEARQNLATASEGLSPSPLAEMILETRSTRVVETMAHVRQLAAAGSLQSALEEALYALQSAPTYMPLHILIGDLLLQNQQTHEAVKKYIVVSELYTVRGETTRAVRLLKRISQLMPTDITVRQRMIDLMSAQDNVDEALTEYMNLADLYFTMADLDKARQTYLDSLKIAQKSKNNRAWGMKLLLKVADIDLQRLNLRQALRIFEQIRTIQPDHAPTRAQIVSLHFRLGQDSTAMKELDEYINFLKGANRSRDAIQFINDLLVDHSTRSDLRKRLADIYIQNQQIKEAVVQLDTVADSLLSENKNMEAVNMLETIISLNPSNVNEYRSALESLRRSMLRK
jgi:tetratricopeptide (TPR) repeat protein